MTKVIKPLLAVKADMDKIKFPVLATPKLDGIRCLMVDGQAMSRTMKPIPNEYVRKCLYGLHGLDGELMVKGDYNDVQSGIMRSTGEPDFKFHVFDSFIAGGGYNLRSQVIRDVCEEHTYLEYVAPILIWNTEGLMQLCEQHTADGYEGTMIRSIEGRYKHGRSTVNEGILLKIKSFQDTEGTLVEVYEKMHNGNVAEKDELGHTKRSLKQEGMVPAGTSGGVIINWQGNEIKAGFGEGWDDAKKQELWDTREENYGRTVKFSYQDLSKDGVPRFAKLIGYRSEDDM